MFSHTETFLMESALLGDTDTQDRSFLSRNTSQEVVRHAHPKKCEVPQ